MPFGIIGRTGPAMRQVVGSGDRSTARVLLGANMGRAVVTNGDFTAYTCATLPRRGPLPKSLSADLLIFDMRSGLSVRAPECQKLKVGLR